MGGSNRNGTGPRNPRGLRELRERAPQVRLIVDAGIGLPSHACQVMEWGFDGVLVNTAVSRSLDPVLMAAAFANSVRAGRCRLPGGADDPAGRGSAKHPGNRTSLRLRLVSIAGGLRLIL